MSLGGHLTGLRDRVGKALLFVVLGATVAFWWYEHGLGDFIRAPYCGLFDELRDNDSDGGCGLLVTDVFGGALIRLTIISSTGAGRDRRARPDCPVPLRAGATAGPGQGRRGRSQAGSWGGDRCAEAVARWPR
jgi:hypothetical protein